MKLAVYSVLVLSALTSAAPNKDYVYKVKESISHPRGWTRQGPAPQDHNIELRIALPQANFKRLEEHLYEISDPLHERYGHHLTAAEVHELVAPSEESVRQVDSWLGFHGIHEENLVRSPARDWVKVTVPVSVAEEMLRTRYHVWTHGSGASVVRTTGYSLPEHLHEHVELVQPTTLFSALKSLKTTVRLDTEHKTTVPPDGPPIHVPSASNGYVNATCSETITIDCLLELYNAVGYNAAAHTGNQIGVTGYLGEYANMQDLQLFYADQRPDALHSNFTFVSVNGGQNDQAPYAAGEEANLDTQFAFGLSHPIPATFFSTAGTPPFDPDIRTLFNSNEPYLDWLDFILNQTHPPQIISTSYGDDEQTVPESYARRVCAGFAQLGARGVSLIFSSGDSGVGDGDPEPGTQMCLTNDGRNLTRFLPSFPASCPYVTTVGGTTGVPEVGNLISGGGFSDVFRRPEYQRVAVQSYLDKLPKGTYAGLFNPEGRAYPDVSAQSSSFKIFLGGRTAYASGTSAAAPAFAGFIALLSDVRLRQGLSPLGFLNPLIYNIGISHPDGFNDVTEGNNPGCGTLGFNATVGWDPVTGLGTPNFGNLKDIVTLYP